MSFNLMATITICSDFGAQEIKSVTVSIGKDSDAGRDWGQEEKGTTEDEMAG